jgi:hypothetical protein
LKKIEKRICCLCLLLAEHTDHKFATPQRLCPIFRIFPTLPTSLSLVPRELKKMSSTDEMFKKQAKSHQQGVDMMLGTLGANISEMSSDASTLFNSLEEMPIEQQTQSLKKLLVKTFSVQIPNIRGQIENIEEAFAEERSFLTGKFYGALETSVANTQASNAQFAEAGVAVGMGQMPLGYNSPQTPAFPQQSQIGFGRQQPQIGFGQQPQIGFGQPQQSQIGFGQQPQFAPFGQQQQPQFSRSRKKMSDAEFAAYVAKTPCKKNCTGEDRKNCKYVHA